jgi:hypothetical protein
VVKVPGHHKGELSIRSWADLNVGEGVLEANICRRERKIIPISVTSTRRKSERIPVRILRAPDVDGDDRKAIELVIIHHDNNSSVYPCTKHKNLMSDLNTIRKSRSIALMHGAEATAVRDFVSADRFFKLIQSEEFQAHQINFLDELEWCAAQP